MRSSTRAGQLSYSNTAAKANTCFPQAPLWTLQHRARPYLLLFPCQRAPTTTANWRTFIQCHLIFHCTPASLDIPPLKARPHTATQEKSSAQTPGCFQVMVIYSGLHDASLGWRGKQHGAVQTHTATGLLPPKEFPTSFPFSVYCKQ